MPGDVSIAFSFLWSPLVPFPDAGKRLFLTEISPLTIPRVHLIHTVDERLRTLYCGLVLLCHAKHMPSPGTGINTHNDLHVV